MLIHIINHEIKTLLRSGWMVVIALLMMAVIGFASYNGYQKTSQRTNDIQEAMKSMAKSDATMLENIEKAEKGIDTGLPYWKVPTSPSVVGFRHPRTVAMDAQPLSLIATGQSDMYSHYMESSTYGNNFALDNTEMSNPVQLLFGTFDLAFVFVFIIPLLIIAFTYDLLSKEKELGTLRVIGAQPISVTKWLFQKLAFRFAFFALVSILFFLVFLGMFAPHAFQNFTSVLLAIFQIIAYELFWFVLAGIVNVKINHSAKNAVILIGLWLLTVLIIPVTANQVGTSLFPTPSRLNMINEIRQANKEMEKKQDKILDAYLRDHPELANTDTTKKYNFWHKYFASQKILQDEIKPLLGSYEEALSKQQKVVNYMKYLSPALVMNESFNRLAGTSSDDYLNYKKQVVEFSEEWRNHIVPLLFQDKKYSRKTYEKRPIFQFKPLANNQLVIFNIIATLVLIGVLLGIVFFMRPNPNNSGSIY